MLFVDEVFGMAEQVRKGMEDDIVEVLPQIVVALELVRPSDGNEAVDSAGDVVDVVGPDQFEGCWDEFWPRLDARLVDDFADCKTQLGSGPVSEMWYCEGDGQLGLDQGLVFWADGRLRLDDVGPVPAVEDTLFEVDRDWAVLERGR